MYTKIIPPPVLNHQGGWDEMLMFLVPALLLTWLRNKQKNENCYFLKDLGPIIADPILKNVDLYSFRIVLNYGNL